MTARSIALLSLLGLLAAALLGCTRPATQLVVLVNSDYLVPGELASVEATISDGTEDLSFQTFELTADPAAEPARHPLPLSFGVVPVGGDASRRVTITVRGLDRSGREVVTRRARTGFLDGQSLLLPMFLLRSCAPVACGQDETCTETGCAPVEVSELELRPIRPGDELDAGPEPVDGGPDSGADAGADAGCVPSGTEVCDRRDNDCNGMTDEVGCGCPGLARGGSVYLFCSATAASWPDARAFCLSRGYDLVVIGDPAEDDWVRSQASTFDPGRWHIGVSDAVSEGIYVSVDGTVVFNSGAALAYCPWDLGQPDERPPGEDCVELTETAAWNDVRCSVLRSFVCEGEAL